MLVCYMAAIYPAFGNQSTHFKLTSEESKWNETRGQGGQTKIVSMYKNIPEKIQRLNRE